MIKRNIIKYKLYYKIRIFNQIMNERNDNIARYCK